MNQVTEYKTIDKTAWPRGEWDNEIDKRQWTDAETGLPCLIVRGPSGALCGYVGVSPGHPLHGKDYDNVDVRVHGGLTYAAGCQHGADVSTSICHIPAKGEDDNTWWFGFDCAHSGDVMPFFDSLTKINFPGSYTPHYRNVSYVTRECTDLALSLCELGAKG